MATDRIAASGLAIPFASNVRRRPVNRLEHARNGPLGVQVARCGQPHPTLKHGTQVGDDIAEHVGRDDHVESFGVRHHPHAARVDMLIVALDLRVFTPDFGEGPYPQVVGEGQHVGLRNQGDLPR